MTGILGGLIGSYPTAAGSGNTLEFVDAKTYSGTAAESTLTISHPVGVQTGDIMVLFHGTYDNDSDYINDYPTNFTPIYKNAYQYAGLDPNASLMGFAVSVRILPSTASISTPVPFGTTTDGHHYVALYFRPNFTVLSITPSSINNQNTSLNPTSRTVSASTGTAPLVVFGSIQTTGVSPAFSTASPAFDNTYDTNAVSTIYSRIGYKIYNSSPQDHTIDMNDLGNQRLNSFYIQFGSVATTTTTTTTAAPTTTTTAAPTTTTTTTAAPTLKRCTSAQVSVACCPSTASCGTLGLGVSCTTATNDFNEGAC